MSEADVVLWATTIVVAGGLVIWFIFYAFSGQRKPASNLTEDTLKRLIGSTGRATSDITGLTGTVFVNSEEFSARTSKGTIRKGDLVRVTEAVGLTLQVEKA
jgi:membrane-bound ClpP family serine protease